MKLIAGVIAQAKLVCSHSCRGTAYSCPQQVTQAYLTAVSLKAHSKLQYHHQAPGVLRQAVAGWRASSLRRPLAKGLTRLRAWGALSGARGLTWQRSAEHDSSL